MKKKCSQIMISSEFMFDQTSLERTGCSSKKCPAERDRFGARVNSAGINENEKMPKQSMVTY